MRFCSHRNSLHYNSEIGWTEGRWTPEELLLCALASCFTTTFQDVAHSAGFDYTDLEVEVEGNVRRDKKGCGFSEIAIVTG